MDFPHLGRHGGSFFGPGIPKPLNPETLPLKENDVCSRLWVLTTDVPAFWQEWWVTQDLNPGSQIHA